MKARKLKLAGMNQKLTQITHTASVRKGTPVCSIKLHDQLGPESILVQGINTRNSGRNGSKGGERTLALLTETYWCSRGAVSRTTSHHVLKMYLSGDLPVNSVVQSTCLGKLRHGGPRFQPHLHMQHETCP